MSTKDIDLEKSLSLMVLRRQSRKETERLTFTPGVSRTGELEEKAHHNLEATHWLYMGMTKSEFRAKKLALHSILDDPQSSSAASWYNAFITVVVFVGYAISALEITRDASIESAPYNGYFYPRTYHIALYPVLGMLALDILLRFLCSERWFLPCECRPDHHHGGGSLAERPFFLQVYTWLDIFALLGGFLGLGCFASALRFIRLAKHVRSFQIVIEVMVQSWPDLKFSLFLLIGVLIFASCFLLSLESPYDKEAEFTDLYSAMYYCFITFSSVGFGDVVADRTIGRAVAGALMVSGTFFLALPLTIIGNNFEKAWEKHMTSKIAELDKKNGNNELTKHHLEKAQKAMGKHDHEHRALLRSMQVQDSLNSCNIHFENVLHGKPNCVLGLKFALERLFLRAGQLAGHLHHLADVPIPVRKVVFDDSIGVRSSPGEGLNGETSKIEPAGSKADSGILAKQIQNNPSRNDSQDNPPGESVDGHESNVILTSQSIETDFNTGPTLTPSSDASSTEEKSLDKKLIDGVLAGIDFRIDATEETKKFSPVFSSILPGLSDAFETIGDAHRYNVALNSSRTTGMENVPSMALVSNASKLIKEGESEYIDQFPTCRDGLRLLGYFWSNPSPVSHASSRRRKLKYIERRIKSKIQYLRHISLRSKRSYLSSSQKKSEATTSAKGSTASQRPTSTTNVYPFFEEVSICFRRCWCRSVKESTEDHKLQAKWIAKCHDEGGFRNWLYLLFEGRNKGHLFKSNRIYLFRVSQIFLVLTALVLLFVETLPTMNSFGQKSLLCKEIVRSYCATINSCLHNNTSMQDPWCTASRISAPSINTTLLALKNPGCFENKETGYGGCLGSICDWPRHDLNMECNGTFEPFGRTWLEEVMHEPIQTSNKYVCNRLQCRDELSKGNRLKPEIVYFVLEAILIFFFTTELFLRLVSVTAPATKRAITFFCSDYGAWAQILLVILGVLELTSSAMHHKGPEFSTFGYFGWGENAFNVEGWSDPAQFRLTRSILAARMLLLLYQWETVEIIVGSFRKAWVRLVIPLFFFFVMAIVFGGALTMFEQGSLWRCNDWRNPSKNTCESCYGPPVMSQPLAHWGLRLVGWHTGKVPDYSVVLSDNYLGHREW